MWICINMQKKIRLFHWFVLEISSIKKSCNLIGWEHFSPYLKLCWNTTNIINFHYRTNSVQITKFFNKFKKTVFGPLLVHFPILGRKKNFSENLLLLYTTSYWFLALCQNLGKTNHTIPWKCPDGRTGERADGRTEGKTNEQILPTTTGG